MLYLRGAEEGCARDVLAKRTGVVFVDYRQRGEFLICVSEKYVGPIIDGSDKRWGRGVEPVLYDNYRASKCHGWRCVASHVL